MRRVGTSGKWVVGVIDKSGVSGVNLGGPAWYLRLTLNLWHEPRQPLAKVPLKLDMRLASRKAFERTAAQLEAGQMRRFRVGSVKLPVVGLREIGRKVHDAALARARPAKPWVVRDSVLGKLVLDQSARLFLGKRSVGRETYRVRIDASETGEEPTLADALRVQARVAIVRLEKNLTAVRRRVTRDLLSPYNKAWREEEVPTISAKEFGALIGLDGVLVLPDGSMDLYFADGDLFAGHAIWVTLDARGKVKTVTLAG